MTRFSFSLEALFNCEIFLGVYALSSPRLTCPANSPCINESFSSFKACMLYTPASDHRSPPPMIAGRPKHLLVRKF